MACLETGLLVYIESMNMHPDSKEYVFFSNFERKDNFENLIYKLPF